MYNNNNMTHEIVINVLLITKICLHRYIYIYIFEGICMSLYLKYSFQFMQNHFASHHNPESHTMFLGFQVDH